MQEGDPPAKEGLMGKEWPKRENERGGKRRSNDSPDHRDSDRPSSGSDTESKVAIVGSLVLSRLHVVNDLGETTEHVGREVLEFARKEKGNGSQAPDSCSRRRDAVGAYSRS